jgi:ferredoxin
VRPVHGRMPGQCHRAGRVPQTRRQGFPEQPGPRSSLQVYHGIRQKTDPAYACIGCAMCNLVCPNDAIIPGVRRRGDKLRMHINRGGTAPQPRRAPQRPGGSLDQIKFIRISMLTDPALDAGRHEFELRTLLGRVLPPEQSLKFYERKRLDPTGTGDLPAHHRRHVLRGPFAQHVGRASDGGGLSQRGAGHAGAHVHRRRRLPAAPAAQRGFSNTSSCRSPAAISAGTRSFTPFRR